jgi:putative ABC transport system ATP-binding protein
VARRRLDTPAAGADSAAVSARHLTRRFGAGDSAVAALRDVSLEIERGRLTAIMGPSGSGKSTLMHVLAGLDKIAGRETTAMGDNELTLLRRDHTGFVFRFYSLLPMLTAGENVKLPLAVAGADVDERWYAELIETVGLSGRLKHRPSVLSGGQQQRVAVARALVTCPTVVSPTSRPAASHGG